MLCGSPVYNRSLEDDVRNDTSGHFQHILISLLQANRSEEQEIDDAKVHKDAKDLYEVLYWMILTKYRYNLVSANIYRQKYNIEKIVSINILYILQQIWDRGLVCHMTIKPHILGVDM